MAIVKALVHILSTSVSCLIIAMCTYICMYVMHTNLFA